jgi:two-component system sensor histidine kinase HydH
VATRTDTPVSKPFNLSRRFFYLSLITIGLVSVVSSVLLSRFLTHRMLQQDAEMAMGFVQSVVKVQGARGYFLGEQAADSNLIEFFNHIATLPDVARANVFAQNKTILWSSDRKLIGQKFENNPDLEKALTGKMEIEIGFVGEETGRKPEHISLGGSDMRFVEIYIPIMDPAGNTIIGVVEIYRIPSALFEVINSGHQIIWTSAVLAGLFLFATLFGMVRRADQLIRSQQEQLVESETLAALGEVASAIAHGIRNPLASIRSSAELWNEVRDADGRESAKDIISEVDRLEKWVRELLTYSQPDQGEVEAVELMPIVQETIQHFARETARRGITIEVWLGEQLPRVKGDPSLLVQVLNNLIVNALEAMQNGGRITVQGRIAASFGHVELSVSDTGAGIPPEHIDKVGNAFYTTKQTGLGVGLALAQRIMKRFGGTMGVESRHGHGTTVTLNLLPAS